MKNTLGIQGNNYSKLNEHGFPQENTYVTENDVKLLAKRLKLDMGGWIFHSKIDFNHPTPHITVNRDHPVFVKEWIANHE